VARAFAHNRWHSQIYCGVWVFITSAFMLAANLNHFFICALVGLLCFQIVLAVGPEFDRWPTEFERTTLTDHLFLGLLYLLMFGERVALEFWRI